MYMNVSHNYHCKNVYSFILISSTSVIKVVGVFIENFKGSLAIVSQ